MGSNLPILVTGAHRSGTTWAGRMLAAEHGTAYISEPLNVWHRQGVYRIPVDHWYTYITAENESHYLPGFDELLRFRYHFWREIRSLRSGRDFLRMVRDGVNFTNGRLRRLRPLIKDPFAVFSAGWFAQRLKCRVVITIRHPAGFASSLKRLGWPFEFKDLLDQPLLMRDHLKPDRARMESIQSGDLIGQASLLWRMIYRVVHTFQTLEPAPLIVRHEDLSRDPVGEYRRLYQSLGLVFDQKVSKVILNSSSSENPGELSKSKVHSVKLDSRAGLDNWKRRLDLEEIRRIRKVTEEVSGLYYSDEDWN